MKIPYTPTFWFLAAFMSFSGVAQIRINSNIYPLKDSIQQFKLMRDLNGLIVSLDKPYELNPYLLKDNLAETAVQMDEVKGLDKKIKGTDTVFFRCHLINIVQADSPVDLIQLAYIGQRNDTLMLRAEITLLTKLVQDTFRFFSPLVQNTSNWKIFQSKQITFHSNQLINRNKIKSFETYLDRYDKKLNIPPSPMDYYIFSHLPEALHYLGVDYKSDFNGYEYTVLSATVQNKYVLVDGSATRYSFDPHDLWHSRLRKAVPRDSINRWVDEGCAYVYGGSWGLSWNDIKYEFLSKYPTNGKFDWFELYQKNPAFGTSSKPLYVAYLINALIVEDLEQKNGFGAVRLLLCCGKVRKDNQNYFLALENLTGISKENFNGKVQEMIEYMKKTLN